MAGDLLLVGVALSIHYSRVPLGTLELSLMILSVALGAALSITPFVLEYRSAVRVAEAAALTTVVSQVSQMEAIAAQISGATGRWAVVQEEAEKVSATAKSIAERMTAEVKAFTEFMQRANDTERANLRLEVEKLRRGESEWVQVLLRILDHVYALHMGAVKSGQPNLIEQLTHFQNACRDAARRVGMVPFVAEPGEPFDSARHRVHDSTGTPPQGAEVANTLATGYTFQGRLLRPALVVLRAAPASGAPPDPKEKAAPEKTGQAELL